MAYPNNFPTSLNDHSANNNITDGDTIVKAADVDNLNAGADALETKVGVDGSAVVTSHDYLLANIVRFPGNTVFNATLSIVNTWQDLDLSGTVGSKKTLCYFQVNSTGGDRYAMKPKGEGGAWVAHEPNQVAGTNLDVSSGHLNTVPGYMYWVCLTDANGEVEIASDSVAGTLTIKLLAYIA